MDVVNGTAREPGASGEGVTAESDPEPRTPSKEEEPLKSLSSATSATPANMTLVDTGPKEAVEHPDLPKEATSATHLPGHQIDPPNGPVATTIDPSNGLVASKMDPSNDLASIKTTTSEPTKQKREDGVSSPKGTTRDPNAAPTVTRDAGATGISTVVRKNIPPKRDRMEPLKLDMSKPTVMPLTSSQLSLQCLECHIIFSDDKSKRRHLKMSHPAEYEQCMLGDALFACYVCDRHFANSTDLMAHQRTHAERKPFTCILCGEAFKRLSHLTVHKKVHCTSEGYTCSDCGRSFKTLTLLKYHSRTHTGEKPYVCKECGKRFMMPKALQKHLQTHNQDEGEENSDKAILAPKPKKQKSEPSERKFPCPHCKARFKTEKTQHHHIKRKHAANRNAPVCRALATQLSQNQGPPLLTHAAIGQSQVLRLDSGGQAPQCIEPEQIKRLIESLGNVQKVNQMVIYGLEPVPHQLQTVNLQPVPGVVQPIRFDLTQTGSSKLVADGIKTLNSEQAEQQVNLTTAPTLNGGVGSSAENTQSSEQTPGHTGTSTGEFQQIPVGEETAVTMEETCAAVKTICESMSINEADEMTSGSKSDETLLEIGKNQTLQLQHPSSLTPTNELEADSGVSRVFLPEEEVQMQSMTLSDAFSLVATDSSQQTEGQVVNLTPEGTQSSTLARVTSEKKSKKKAGIIVPEQKVGQPHLGTFVQPKDHMGHAAQKTSQSNSEVHASEETSGQTLPPPHESNEGGVTTNVAKPLKAKKGRPANKKSNKTQAKKSVHSALLKQKNDIHNIQQRNTAPHPPLQVLTFATQEETQTKGHVLVKFGLGGKNEKLSKKDGSNKALKKGKDGKLQEKELHQQSQKGEEGKGKTFKTHEKKKTPAEILNKPQNQKQNGIHLEEVKSKVKSRKRKSKTQSKDSKGMAVKEGTIAPSPKKKKREQIIMPKSIELTSEVEVTKENSFKQNSKGVIPTAVPPDQIKSDVLLLLKGHKQPQLKVHKLDAPQNLSQSEQVPSHTTSDPMTLIEETTTACVKQTDDRKKTSGVSKNLKRQSSTDHLGSSVRKKAKVGRKKKPTNPAVAASPSLVCDDPSKYSEEPVSLEPNSCEPQKEFVGHDTSTPVRTPLTKEMTPSNLVSPKTFELQVTSDWDAEMEMRELGLGDREDQRVSFPALNPSPSLPHVPALAEGEQEEVRKDGNSGMTGDSLEAVPSLAEGMKSLQSVTCPESTRVHQTPSQLSSTSLSESTHVTAPKDQSATAVSSAKGKNNKRRKTKKKLSETGDKMSKIQDSSDAIQTPCEPDKVVEEDSKEDLPLDVNLVTVEEETRPITPHDEEPPESPQKDVLIVNDGQSKLSSQDDNDNSLQRTSSENDSSNPPQIKEEDAEKEVHAEERKCQPESNRRSTARGRKKGGGGRGRRGNSKKRNTGNRSSTEHEPLINDKDECRIVYQLYPVAGDSGITKSLEGKGAQVCPDPPRWSDQAESQVDNSEEQVVFELESVTTSVVDMVKSEAELEGQDRTEGSSPGLLLEKFLTSRGNGSGESAACGQVVADATNTPISGANRASTLPTIGQPGAISIKEEEMSQPVMPPVLLPEAADTRGPLISNPLPVEQQQQGVQMFVVKEEDPLILNDPQGSQDSQLGKRKDGSFSTSGASAASESPVELERNMSGSQLGMVASPIHQPSAKQCIFFPVKEEDRELVLDSPSRSESQNNSSLEECDDICEISQPDAQCVDSGFIDEDERGGDEHSTADLVEFLSQSSDTENSEFFDNDPVSETLALACYHGNRSSGSANLPAGSSNLPGDRTSQLSQNDGSSSQGCQRKPIDYFTQYFNWKTWQDVANVTAKTSKMPIAVTAKEVSQFVGIHIAMGSLQFPSTKLYWEEFTRVPLIADAMPLSRFLELLSKLRFAAAEERGPARAQGSGNNTTATETCSTQPDPLHRVRTLVEKVQRGCRNLKREGNHGVSQYPLELLRSTMAKSPYSLHHTVMLSTAGLVVDFNLGLDDSDREDTVKKMVLSGDKSTDGMVFLCKPELSIPSMLEQLLDAGVQSAGKVGGARGQVGDEFVSSDGKLKLFRCHHGFILSAAAKGRSRSTSLVSGFERAMRAAKLNRDLRSSYRTPCLATSPGAWPLSVLWHLADLALVNSWLEHRSDHNSKQAPLSLLAFRLEVSKALIMSSSADAQDATPPQPPAPQRPEQGSFPGSPSILEAPLPDTAVRYDGLGHWPEQVAQGEGARCRFGGCERTSQVRCLKCCVFLCISRHHNCFLKFHSQGAV